MTDPRQAKAPGGYSEGHHNVLADTPILPMSAAECVVEWAESLIFSEDYHAGRADGYAAAWDEAAHWYLEHAAWRAHFLDVARFGIDKAERLRRDRERVIA